MFVDNVDHFGRVSRISYVADSVHTVRGQVLHDLALKLLEVSILGELGFWSLDATHWSVRRNSARVFFVSQSQIL